MTLSDAGRAFLREAEPLLDRLNDAAMTVMAFGGQARVLRMAVLPTFARLWLIPRLQSFQSTMPGLTFDMASRLAPVDFAPTGFAPGHIRRTRLAQVAAAVWMPNPGTVDIITFRSVAQYAFDALAQAANSPAITP